MFIARAAEVDRSELAGPHGCMLPGPDRPAMIGRVVQRSAALQTTRLRLEPVTTESAHAILAGDFSGWRAADGRPHEDTADGLAMAVRSGHPPGWLITVGGRSRAASLALSSRARPRSRTGSTARLGGEGPATRAAALLLDMVPVRPPYARAASDNAGSLRVLQKSGFKMIRTKTS
jgi:hypothetical protein